MQTWMTIYRGLAIANLSAQTWMTIYRGLAIANLSANANMDDYISDHIEMGHHL